MRRSERRHWEAFWGARRDPEEIYPDSPALMEHLLRRERVAGKRVLEVGAGSGRDAVALAQAGAEVSVLDYAINALAHVRENAERAGVPVARVRADARQAPFPDGHFDLVLHQGLLEHFRDPMPLLKENFRVLRPGGRLYCAVPQTIHPYTVLKKILIAADRWFAGWETEYTPRGLERVVREAGFRVEGRFGGWMVPSLGYRVARTAFGRLGVRLPMDPKAPGPFREMRRQVARRLAGMPVMTWTFLVVGVVAERPEW